MFHHKRSALAFALLSMLGGPGLLFGVLGSHKDELRGVFELAPAVVSGLMLFGLWYGIKRAWRIHCIETDEVVRERVRRRVRRRYSQ